MVDRGLQQRLVAMPLQLSRINAAPTNYGERVHLDAQGQRIDPTPAVIVLHETVYSLGSAINTFTTPHPNDDQASYHTLVGQKGEMFKWSTPASGPMALGTPPLMAAGYSPPNTSAGRSIILRCT